MKAILILIFFVSFLSLFAQQRDSLESALSGQHGKEKLITLHRLIEHLHSTGDKKELKYAKEANELAEDIIHSTNKLITKDELSLKPVSHYYLGRAYYNREQYSKAKEYLDKVLPDIDLMDNDKASQTLAYLEQLEDKTDDRTAVGTFLKKNLENIDLGNKVSSATENMSLSTTLKLARYHEKNNNYVKAIEQYEKAINQYKDQGESEEVYFYMNHVASLYEKSGQYHTAINYYEKINDQVGIKEDTLQVMMNKKRIAQLETIEKEVSKLTPSALDKKTNITHFAAPELPQDKFKRLADQMEAQHDFKKSLEYYKEYVALQRAYEKQQQEKELALLEQINYNENKEREIKLLQQEKEIQRMRLSENEAAMEQEARFRNMLIIGTSLLGALAIALWLMYNMKRRNHNRLQSAYQDLESTQDQLSEAEKKIRNLLGQQVSGAVADALITTAESDRIDKRFVCVMFLDIRNFTPFVENKTPEEIIQFQNDVFGFMIDIIEQHNGVINQLLGDGFMATFGAPVSTEHDCDNAFEASKEIIRELEIRAEQNILPAIRVGIGLHAGDVVVGNVGNARRKQYSITGNPVITAARIEQLTKEFGVQLLVSREVYENLTVKPDVLPDFKAVHIKGRFEPVETWSVI
ncbi:tetratricopeptide repeat protein [Fulvivirga sp. 29W222]|uniref:Tetratricopeptide repeat protein n=1 Tax=Fulvivirga marina TaxID=2494733 RepID=A0A937KBB7_9BACT|nr:adenylate/guanylate cyclase domain-containing protein [Fulvivirga marina]MBL6446671.1 tetratricopeptide repeat protein [Fulvivirga marina]